MMRYVLICLLLLFASLLPAQSTERYIRVIGNAAESVVPASASIPVKIKESMIRTKDTVIFRSFEENRQILLEGLILLGISEESLVEIMPDKNRNSRTRERRYQLTLDPHIPLEKIIDLTQEDISFGSASFDYYSNTELAQRLAIAAIQDAKRKAKVIAEASGMKAGKILNIEDKPLTIPPLRGQDARDRRRVEHIVAVTFELKG